MWIAGKQGCITQFITVYYPVYTGKGDNTVYTQQLRELTQDPMKRFWTDLGTEILNWKAAGEQIIISGDWNEKVTSINIQNWMGLFGLKELITSMHEGEPPPTFQKGKDAIDGIFRCTDFEPERAGYLGFGQTPGDHRAI